MNIENATKLRDHLAWLKANGLERKFAMDGFLQHPAAHQHGFETIDDLRQELFSRGINEPIAAHECGTVACLAGHCALLGGAKAHDYVETFAREWLDLHPRDAHSLFYGYWADSGKLLKPLCEITLDEAIAHLDTLIERERARP